MATLSHRKFKELQYIFGGLFKTRMSQTHPRPDEHWKEYRNARTTSSKNLSNRRDKDKDKDKDIFIGPKEFVSPMMTTQTKYRLYHQLK